MEELKTLSSQQDIELPEPPTPPQNQNQGIVQAAAVLAIGNVVSRLLGLVREVVKASLFGASGLLSAFEIAALVPKSLFDLVIGGMVSSALVPVFSDYADEEHRQELWALFSTVLSVTTVVMLFVVAIVEMFAPQVALLVGANEFDDPQLTVTAVSLMRLATPAVLFMSLASVITGGLYALKRFTLPAFVGAVFNGTIVVVALIRPQKISNLVWGLLIGSLLQIVMQLPAMRDAKIKWQFNWKHPAVRRILKLYAPIVAGLIINQLAVMLSFNLATRTGDQSVSYMRFATTLYQFPLGLVVTALSIATLPTLSRQAIDQLDAFKRTLAEGIRLVMTLILPATAGLFALAVPIVALVFERGQFTGQDTLTTALVLRVYLFGLPFAAIDQMLVFASYARKNTWQPALVGVLSIGVYSATAVLLLRPLGLLSLMVADSVKHIVHTLMMLWLLQRHVGGLAGHGILPNILKSLGAAILTGLVAYQAAEFVISKIQFSGFWGSLMPVVVGGVAGLLVYGTAVFLLGIEDAKLLRQIISRKK